MSGIFSQFRAALALAKASLIAMLRSPTSVVFSLLFPVIFIVVFGSMVDNSVLQLKIVLAPGCDTANPVFDAIHKMENVTLHSYASAADATEAVQKGRLTAVVDIQKSNSNSVIPKYEVTIVSSPSSEGQRKLLQTLLSNAIASINEKAFPSNPSIASLHTKELPGRKYRKIDFILPGQLGFSLLMAGVFGSAFLLFNLRNSLVLKRLAATPITRGYLVLGEMLSRLFFHVVNFVIMVALGYFVFDFTLVNGIYTFTEMMVFSLLGLIIFMGIGFIISGATKNESSIAPVANTFTLPQILLCGLFFPVENYPHWLQSFCNILPLTFFVDGLRKIAFEGAHIWQMPVQLAGLGFWAIAISFVAVKVFRWE